jgi:hypothetical protein
MRSWEISIHLSMLDLADHSLSEGFNHTVRARTHAQLDDKDLQTGDKRMTIPSRDSA